MWDRIKRLLLPPVFDGDEEKTNQARLLYILLIIIILAAGVFPIVSLMAGAPIEPIVGVLVITLISISVGLNILMRLGYVQPAAVILGLIWWGLFTFGIFNFGGLHDTAITGFFFLIIFTSVIGGWQVLLGFGVLTLISFVGVYFAEQLGIIEPILYIPSDSADLAMPIVITVASILVLRVSTMVLTNAYTQARESAQKLEVANQELQVSRDDLAKRATDLERRTRYLEATASVARDVASELDPDILLRRVVNLVSDQFNLYHAGLFLIEVGGEYAVLRAASSKGGQRMLDRGHRLRVGQEGIVGYVAGHGNSRVVLDTGIDAAYFDNPDLPDTRSEVALPLRVRGEVIGVLDVQSTEANAFEDEDITVLQTLADQIAVALKNAQLFQQVEVSLEAQRRAYGDSSRDAWLRIAAEKDTIGYQYIQGDVAAIKEQPQTNPSGLPEISIPIIISGQVVGHITAHKSAEHSSWLSDEITIMETLSNQLSVALDSARLYQDSQKRAAREQLSGEVTSRIRETLDVETILRTASEEIRKALNLPEVVIRLGNPSSSQTGGATE